MRDAKLNEPMKSPNQQSSEHPMQHLMCEPSDEKFRGQEGASNQKSSELCNAKGHAGGTEALEKRPSSHEHEHAVVYSKRDRADMAAEMLAILEDGEYVVSDVLVDCKAEIQYAVEHTEFFKKNMQYQLV